MTISDILAHFVLSRHTPLRDVVFDGAEQKFITCFDVDGNEVSTDDVSNASPGGKQGELEYFTPTPGVGYYAHLRIAGTEASRHGASTRYEIAGPDWKAMVHVTEPAAGRSSDVIVDEFAVTDGAQKFAKAIASRLL